jgi:molybdopterin-guanine dinucleotide biosynthesis protein A
VIEAEGFVLAGGRSTRMGRDKALLRVAGQSLVERALNKLRSLPLAAPPRIAGAASYLSNHAALIDDLHPGCGPLSGIEAALAASTKPLNVVLSVDIPLLPARFLDWMLLRAETTGALATIPLIAGRPQPLCAVYRRELLSPITAALIAGNYKVIAAMTEAAGHAIDLFDTERVTSANPELLRWSPLPLYRWFHNCNTPEDVAAIENALVLTQ